jgi:hypothetical protein
MMRVTAIGIALIALGLGPHAAAVAQVPKLNVDPTCEAAARGSIVLGRDKQACLGDERAAQETLQKGWGKYNAGDKTQCVGLARQGGPPSYVELLSCLEVMRDSKTIRSNGPLAGAPGELSAAGPTVDGARGRRRGRRSQPVGSAPAAPAVEPAATVPPVPAPSPPTQ